MKVGTNLVSTRGIADINMRVAADAFSTVYLIGRVRLKEEFNKTVRVAKKTKGVKKLVNNIKVRP